MQQQENVFLIQRYYQVQEHRIAMENQIRALKDEGIEKPCEHTHVAAMQHVTDYKGSYDVRCLDKCQQPLILSLAGYCRTPQLWREKYPVYEKSQLQKAIHQVIEQMPDIIY